MSTTLWPAACPRCGGDVVRIGYPDEDLKVQRRQFRCWSCHVPLEQVPGSEQTTGGSFQVAVEVEIRRPERPDKLKLSTW